MKIFIAGSRGQLGYDCMQVLEGKHELRSMDLPELDIASASSVEAALGAFQPDVVINCAAYTKVDACEEHREEARNANALGPKLLAQYTDRHNAALVHISTDYVFDGQQTPPQPYTEDDPTLPSSFYGISKLEGEQAIKMTTDRYVILRTAWLYGINGHNFMKTMLRLALKQPDKTLRVVNDQFGTPTWSYRLALQIEKIIEAGAQGLYHATDEGWCSWYDLAAYFLKTMQAPHRIQPCTTAEYPTPARRPANSILENKRLKEQGLNIMAAWKSDVNEFVRKYQQQLIQEVSGK
ncbi:MAG TPA: dTDP-4-dehydrorhamnose reductase [Verrucomicrobia bacterium]|nr:MAG: dTDP-4-dehydrorhamnose reductase [Lentisphaerae bacterium GWF2_57_35]HBA82460.1 dTDP-4-dehydrorhamnose reductase [Verrucomicrobiota bacterium]